MLTCFNILVIISILLSFVQSYNILIMNLIPFHSHLMTTSVIANELSDRGHNVTFITLKATNSHPNLNVIKNEDVFRLTPNFPNIVGNFSAFTFGKFMMDKAASTSDELLATPLFKKMIHMGVQNSDFQDSKPDNGMNLYNIKYDLIIAEPYFMQEVYAAGFSEKYKCPLVIYQPILTPPHVSHMLGNPYNPAFMADYKLRYTGQMNFWQRFENTILSLYEILYQNLIYLPEADKIMRKHFDAVGAKNWPYIKDILRNRQSLTLVDTHHIITDPKLNNPNIFEIGGIHIKTPKRLPIDIQDFITSSQSGVIFFAMGTFVDGKNLSPKKIKALLKLFSELKENIIWKIDPETFNYEIPRNVKIGKWFPQNDILAHPKCKLFITHGGIHSVLESLYHGVPMVGIPVFADQAQNALALQEKGMGRRISFDFSYDELNVNVNEVLNNPSYKTTITRYSEIYKDEVKGLNERIMYYIEYVVRHNGAPHLKSAATKLMWYQYMNLDILLVVVGVLVGFTYFVYTILNYSFNWKKSSSAKHYKSEEKKFK